MFNAHFLILTCNRRKSLSTSAHAALRFRTLAIFTRFDCLTVNFALILPFMSEPQSALLLRKQLAELNKNPVEGFSAGLIDDNDIYRWEVLIIGPPDTLYEGGFFKAHLYFPKEYPLRPPKMKFITEIWHPNIDKNGDVCISILHEPGDDKWGYEKASERWLPVHTVETILISVISMLADPNDESPANVDAAMLGVLKNGGKTIRISKGKWHGVLEKVKKNVCRDNVEIFRQDEGKISGVDGG
ncbi:hypothetical protein J437_LFUL009702 [Ladona fulva]|uniref:E2 ubiquitin-conjugating enzyme n=1 Tax=Ladona fulva TaxID=123851 RepID=A0A8K0K074_LADFU|nr:hypothetical protein J437_LFUL009702 [Ladona fulva]